MGVLDDMTKGVVQRKAAASGPKLTPVGTEASPTKPSQAGIPEVPEVFLTNEAVADIAKDLRQQAETLVRIAEGLEGLTDTAKVEAADPVATQKAAEKAADEKHAKPEIPGLTERIEAIKAEAEAPKPAAPVTDGWSCPTHGVTDIKELTSRTGRAYRACGKCDQFEKPSKSRETQ